MNELAAVLQIIRGNRDTFEMIIHIFTVKNIFCDPSLESESSLRGVITYIFSEKYEKLSLNYPQYPLLSGAVISSVTGWLHNRIMTPNIQEYLSLNESLSSMIVPMGS